MTELAMAKAAKVLLNKDGLIGEDRYLPRVWVVGDEVCLFFMAAVRHQTNIYTLYNIPEKVEEVTIEQVYEFIRKRPMPPSFARKIERGFNQTGDIYGWEQLYGWQVKLYQGDARLSKIINNKPL